MYIQKDLDDAPEFASIKRCAEDYEIIIIEKKHISKTNIDHKDILYGDHETMRIFLSKNHPSYEIINTYPAQLFKFYHRLIKRSTVKDLESSQRSWFIKPFQNHKSFQAQIFTPGQSAPVGRNTKIYVSEIVEWKSEYRYYVMKKIIIGGFAYSGDQSPDLSCVEEMVASLDYPCYVLDVGVLKDGRTALIEANPFFSCGNYGLTDREYWEFFCFGWQTL